jgi:enamine deaminase RidA (YjgF/YER057c/UK114 family)
MLESLSDQVRECLRHAEDCVQQAGSQTDAKLRQDFLIMTTCWLKLTYELTERLANISK